MFRGKNLVFRWPKPVIFHGLGGSWYIHLVDFYGKCMEIYHTWILWGHGTWILQAFLISLCIFWSWRVFFSTPPIWWFAKGKKDRFVLYFSSVSSSKQPFFAKFVSVGWFHQTMTWKKIDWEITKNFPTSFIRNFLKSIGKKPEPNSVVIIPFFHPMLLCRVPELPRTTRSTAGTVETSTSRDSR